MLVFAEAPAERRIGSKARFSNLAMRELKKDYYNHVGVKTCVRGDTHIRTEEKVAKARKCLNMSTAIGIRKGGIKVLQ